MDKIITTLRILATLILCYAVYKETGLITSLTIFLIAMSLEAQAIIDEDIIEILKTLKAKQSNE